MCNYSEKNMIRSYEELIKYVPLIKDLMEQDDAEALNVLYKNVSFGCTMICSLLILRFLAA
jgi:hypothetical protein